MINAPAALNYLLCHYNRLWCSGRDVALDLCPCRCHAVVRCSAWFHTFGAGTLHGRTRFAFRAQFAIPPSTFRCYVGRYRSRCRWLNSNAPETTHRPHRRAATERTTRTHSYTPGVCGLYYVPPCVGLHLPTALHPHLPLTHTPTLPAPTP